MAPRGKKGNVNVHGLTNSKKVSKKQKMNKTKGQKAQKFIIERRRKAEELAEALKQTFPDAEIRINGETARPASFECDMMTEDGNKIQLWSGIKRLKKVKFPETEEVIDAAKKAL